MRIETSTNLNPNIGKLCKKASMTIFYMYAPTRKSTGEEEIIHLFLMNAQF